MTEHDKERAFIEKTRQMLDQGVEQLDPATANELRLMRKHALNPQQKRLGRFTMVPVFIATAAVLVVTVSLVLDQTAEQPAINALEDLPLLTETEELDFYQDLDFYDWLDHETIKS